MSIVDDMTDTVHTHANRENRPNVDTESKHTRVEGGIEDQQPEAPLVTIRTVAPN
jgi:hypothetical protein